MEGLGAVYDVWYTGGCTGGYTGGCMGGIAVRVPGGVGSELVSVDWCGGDGECVRHVYVQ